MKGEGVGRASIHDATHPHPALRAGLSLPGRGVFSLPRNCDVQTVTSVAPSHVDSSPSPWLGRGRGWKVREWVERRSTTQPTLTRRCAPASPCQGEASFLCPATAMCKPSLRRTKPRRLLSLALARARERMKGEGVGRASIHDATDPHPALRAGLSLAGRGVSLLLRWKQPAASCPLTRPSKPLSAPSGAERVWVRWGRNHRTATHRVAHTCCACGRVHVPANMAARPAYRL